MMRLFNNSNEFQKAVFIDCINDLLNWTFTFKPAVNLDEIPEWIYIKRLTNAIVQYIVKHYPNPQAFLDEVKEAQEHQAKILNKGINNDTVWLLNVTKERIVFLKTFYWKEVKNIYDGHLWKDELDEIHYHRGLCLETLIDKGIVSELMKNNPELALLIKDFLKSITIKKNWKTEMRPIKDISDMLTREIFKNMKAVVGGERKLREWFKYFFDKIDIQSYGYKKDELEWLLEKMTWNKTLSNESTHKYLDDFIHVYYNWREISSEKWTKPYTILSEIFNSENKWEISLMDIFSLLYSWEEYSASIHSKEKRQISSSIAWINRRFRDISGKKNLLQFKNNIIKKLR